MGCHFNILKCVFIESSQLFDFRAPNDAPSCVVYHSNKQIFTCGFNSGAVRMFHIPSTAMLAEHKLVPYKTLFFYPKLPVLDKLESTAFDS